MPGPTNLRTRNPAYFPFLRFSYYEAGSVTSTTLPERLISYLESRGWPPAYTPSDLNEKWLFLDWVVFNLLGNRPRKRRQLFVYGQKKTQKTLFMRILGKVWNIFSTIHSLNDLSKANDFYDLFLVDNFGETSIQEGSFHRDDSAERNLNSLLMLLDGPPTRPSAVKGRRRNVPIIIIGQKIPDIFLSESCLCGEKVIPWKFFSHLEDLKEERTSGVARNPL